MKETETIRSAPRTEGTVWKAFRAAAPQTLPVFAGYLVLGLGYGIYVQSLGLPVWLPPLMGTVVYGGSLEFVLASLLLGSFAPVSAFLMALMIQARHLFYGLTMLQRYRGYGLRSAYMIFAMSDETFSITCSAEPPEGVDKDRKSEYSKTISDLNKQKNSLLEEYGKGNKVVGQLIDLALLANGLLKGEALNRFVKRSVELIK